MANKPLEGHGTVGRDGVPFGTREVPFTRLLPPNRKPYALQALTRLAEGMIIADDELKDGPDAEENLYVPAGYTYFGQFVDHDLTFDTTSTFDPKHSPPATNLRTPRLDLDCLYGSGPADQPYLYDIDGVKLLPVEDNAFDLVRIPPGTEKYGRAVIGDKRNDENSIVCQIHLAMIKFHNTVVESLRRRSPRISNADLFIHARDEVRWTYQRIVMEDYLRRVIDGEVIQAFQDRFQQGPGDAYTLYTSDKRRNLPVEFVGAAYRFGHSMVRTGYRLNEKLKRRVFSAEDNTETSLVGFEPLTRDHVINNWSRFFTDKLKPGQREQKNEGESKDDDPSLRLQYAYKIDPSLVDPLGALASAVDAERRSLALLNLRRGNSLGYRLCDGQAIAAALGEEPLDPVYLCVRSKVEESFTFSNIATIDESFSRRTPLWFYILAEAQKPIVDLWQQNGRRDLVDDDLLNGKGAGTQLGPVGGGILLEVFSGILDEDRDSYRHAANWRPLLDGPVTMFDLLKFAGLPV